MSYQYRQLIFALAIGIGPVLILEGLGYGYLSIAYVLLLLLVWWLLPHAFGNLSHKIVKENIEIPAKFQNYHNELLALGFELDSLLIMTNFFVPRKQWIYRHKPERVEAYISEESSYLWFSSYFEKGFDVSTRFQNGPTMENEKMVSHIVKTSIPAAFDYHLHHCQKYLSQYGPLLLFERVEEQIEWEKNQKFEKAARREVRQDFTKLLGRLVLSLVVFTIVLTILYLSTDLVFKSLTPENAEQMQELWFSIFLPIASLVTGAWAIWPSLFPKSVEERKKKEAV